MAKHATSCTGLRWAEVQAWATSYIAQNREQADDAYPGLSTGEAADEVLYWMLQAGWLKECRAHAGFYRIDRSRIRTAA